MKRADYLRHRLTCFASDPRCPTDFDLGLKAVISGISVSSSLTSRRYPIWPLVRKHLDGVFEECIERYNSRLPKELLAGVPLSEMAQRPPLVWAAPIIIPVENGGTALDVEFAVTDFVDVKPEGMPEIDWQLLNLGRWDSNLRFAISSLLSPSGVLLPEADALFGALESVRELFRLFGSFRPKLTKALWDLDALIDDRTRPQDTSYCELCWRESIRSKKLDEIDAKERQAVRAVLGTSSIGEDGKGIRWDQAWMLKVGRQLPPKIAKISRADATEIKRLFDQFKAERIFAGNLSQRYCSIHKPGSSKYHADLRYKSAFQNHIKSLVKGEWHNADYPLSFSIHTGFDEQEVRKTAYDQVHSRLHANALPSKAFPGLREKVGLMLAEGLTQSEIARRLGISRQAVSKARKSLDQLLSARHAGMELDIRTGEARVSARVLGEIRAALQSESGSSIAAIAQEVGLMKDTVDGLVRLMRAGNL
ncbi:helix-turn-helix domain-containing protein [Stutzerimonas nitrititolerans]|uniref:helix-turn-helix domain-containing protein n=1 Tax=Stutzerimonas nitrititolerans TaxID=2482751 RepID=UPI0028A082FF|nr:helix-turn-helix domain-containing protein [Stutzerimonas nitrititolerans]